ncbi:MAG: S41 family peptidase [Phycisphaerae bacterium]
MHRWSERSNRCSGAFFAVCSVLAACSVGRATDVPAAGSAGADELWREGIRLVEQGEFERAEKTIQCIEPGTEFTGKVIGWLADYTEKQAKRRELDRADFEMYVGYAKARIERKEYNLALGWTLYAADCAEDRDALLKSDWLQNLVNDALAAADKLRKEQDWRGAWDIYAPLADLYDREPRYKKLEREALTHVRLETMFKEGSHWEEPIEHVRWRDAERALEYVGSYYVEPPDFKRITESGLEQLLLLAESKAAQQRFDGLHDQTDRRDFVARVQARLDQVRKAGSLDLHDAVGHFRRVVKTINAETVRLPEELLVSELMRGAFEPLDDFTTIIWPEESDEFDKHTRGDFVGVGISIVKNRSTDEIEVVTPLEDAPAYYAGIQAGDVITHVDGDSIESLSLNKVVDIITGPENTLVTLTIRRGSEELIFPLKRQTIRIESVKGLSRDETERWNHWLDKENGVGYIRIGNFMRNTPEVFENVLSELHAGGLKGLVLDLRGNPGGLLDTAWRISKLFLRRSESVVTTKGRNRSENQRLTTEVDGAYSDLPVVVLADESSASASEIVAGAIRDNHHGYVVGARTFGKFSVQNLIPLGHSRAKLKITTARYYLPSGVCLHREPNSETWGVEPDIPVRLVHWERVNMWKMRRDAELLGPPKPEKQPEEDKHAAKDGDDHVDEPAKAGETGDKADATAGKDDRPKPDDAGHDAPKPADAAKPAEKVSTSETPDSDKDALPPLEQVNENNRPMEDAQLDTALLLMRVKLLGALHPTLARADTASVETPARP